MQTPTDFQLMKLAHAYDPVKAHEYYLRVRELKGRKQKQIDPTHAGKTPSSNDPRTGKTRVEISKNAREKQKKELTAAIQGMETRLHKLEALIKVRAHEEASHNRKAAAKKERAD
jgi:hypothetical protein